MVWVRFEDGYPRNRKVAALSDAAFRLDVSAICWSNATGADGRILPHELTEIRAKATSRHAAELVAQGRWHAAGSPCPHSETCPASTSDGGGWVIHDIWEQQPTAAKVEEDRKAKAERQKKWLAKKKGGDTSIDPSRDASQDKPADVLEDIAPSPPRPAPKGGGVLRTPSAGPPPTADGAAAAGEAEEPTPVAVTTTPGDGFGLVDERAIAARAAADRAAQQRAIAEHEATTQRGMAAVRAALGRSA